jgi:phage terminase large subunit-like protein
VQIAAVTEEQAVSNVYSLVWQLLSENEEKAAKELGIDLGRQRLYLKHSPGAKLEAVTSSWGAREGQRVTFALLDESDKWTKSNGGHRLARVLGRNAAKVDGRTLELANAHELGEDSTAEQTATTYESGAPGVLFSARRPSTEPDPAMPDAHLRKLMDEVYSGSPWVDLGRLMREVRDPGVPWSEISRFYFNVASPGTSAAVDPILWDSLELDRGLEDGERIALGFDGSHSGDATAIVGCTEDGWLFPVLILERPQKAEDWRVDRSQVQRALEHMFSKYKVQFLYADPWRWQDELEEWSQRWRDKVVEWPTNSPRRQAPAVDRFRTALQEARLHHDGDPDLRRHVLNARLRKVGRDDDGRGRFLLEKAGPNRYMDAAVAATLAVEAAAQIPARKVPMFAWVQT